MKAYLILLPIFVFAIFQGAFLSVNLVLLVVLIWSTFRDDKKSLWVAFAGGLILDISLAKTLGLSSLLLLLSSFLIILYRRRFDPSHFVFLPVFTFFLSILFDHFAKGRIDVVNSLVLSFIAIIVRLVLAPFFEDLERREIKMR